MRSGAVLMASAFLAACLQIPSGVPSDDPTAVEESGLHAFDARFRSEDCEVVVKMGAPEQIAGPDLETELAYRLWLNVSYTGEAAGDHAVVGDEHGDGCGLWGSLDGPYIVHLDGSLRIARVSSQTEVGSDGPMAVLDYSMRGSVPPLGIFWDQTSVDSRLPFRIGASVEDRSLATRNGWRSMDDPPVVSPVEVLMPRLSYRPDGLVPLALMYPGVDSGVAPKPPTTLHRVELRLGDPLPEIPAAPALPPAPLVSGLAPRTEETLFAMNTSIGRAVEVIKQSSEEAARWLEQGCVGSVSVRPAGGAAYPPPAGLVLPSQDRLRMVFHVQLGNEVRMWTYEKTYSGDSVAARLFGVEDERVSQETAGTDHARRYACGNLRTVDWWSWQGLLLDAYALGLHDDVIPCGLSMQWWGDPVIEGSPGVRPRAIGHAHLAGHAATDHPWVGPDGYGPPPATAASAAMSEDGMWWRLHVPQAVALQLDAGAWEPTPLPPFDVPENHPFRCLPVPVAGT